MSFRNYKSVIEEGDTVILYMSNTMHAIDVFPEIKNKKDVLIENVFQTMFGALKVRTLIGKKYGDKVSTYTNILIIPTFFSLYGMPYTSAQLHLHSYILFCFSMLPAQVLFKAILVNVYKTVTRLI